MGSKKDELLQWCHGAPAIIPTLIKAAAVLNHPQYLQQAEKFADVVWQRGLLRKFNGLCHGISGNLYSFLSLFAAASHNAPSIDKHKNLFRAACFEQFSAREGLPFLPEKYSRSLFEGLAGTICADLDFLDPSAASFPCYPC